PGRAPTGLAALHLAARASYWPEIGGGGAQGPDAGRCAVDGVIVVERAVAGTEALCAGRLGPARKGHVQHWVRLQVEGNRERRTEVNRCQLAEETGGDAAPGRATRNPGHAVPGWREEGDGVRIGEPLGVPIPHGGQRTVPVGTRRAGRAGSGRR